MLTSFVARQLKKKSQAMVAISSTNPLSMSSGASLIPPLSSTGFSFSPGGLLFPYHLGVITSLEHHGRLTDQVHLAGASAGAIGKNRSYHLSSI